MTLKFAKYQGIGNDFIMIWEAENKQFQPDAAQISQLCERRFGIGADGLIIIKTHEDTDFEVDYYNADGSQSFCGNGARCSVQFAKNIGIIDDSCQFMAIDGLHSASFSANGDVKLLMNDVQKVERISGETSDYVLDTGSPHYVRFCDNDELDIVEFGREIRYNDRFKQLGINVNTARRSGDYIQVQTYERGVEGETFSCGTGVTAVALADAVNKTDTQGSSKIRTKGGELLVHWKKNSAGGFESIYLEGPAKKVYDGQIEL